MRLRHLGPGILLAATSVGASHILMSPEAGARFEHRLLWLVVLVHLLKYPAFEHAPRYVAARGESLLDAYARAPGPKGWALRLGIVDMTVQAVGLIAALVGLTASFVVAAGGGLRLEIWSLLLTAGLLALLRWGRYGWLRGLNLVLMLIICAVTAIAFAAAPPDPATFAAGLRPSLPDGSMLLVAAILGVMPTSVAVSIWQSLWALEQGRFAAPGAAIGERLERLRRGLFDLRLGYAVSAILAVLFVSLGATLLHPRGLVPEGPEVAITLSNLYTLVLGEWMRPAVLAMAFAALLTTCSTMMDGFPRSFVAVRRALRGEPSTGSSAAASSQDDARSRVYWIFLLAVTFGGMALLALLPDPALLVQLVGAFGLVLSPIYFTLNLWAVTRLVDDPRLRPGPAGIAFSLVGIASLIFAAGLLLWTELGAPR